MGCQTLNGSTQLNQTRQEKGRGIERLAFHSELQYYFIKTQNQKKIRSEINSTLLRFASHITQPSGATGQQTGFRLQRLQNSILLPNWLFPFPEEVLLNSNTFGKSLIPLLDTIGQSAGQIIVFLWQA